MGSQLKDQRLLICNCGKSMPLDAGKLKHALKLIDAPIIHDHLCRAQIGAFETALGGDAPLLVACTQEAPLFREIAERADRAPGSMRFANIRELAGWTTDKKNVTAKIAALLADACFESEPAPTVTLKSEGRCLVFGHGQIALETAQKLAGRLNVTLLLGKTHDVVPPPVMAFPIFAGRVTAVTGVLGRFHVTIEDFAPSDPTSKDELRFGEAPISHRADYDLVLDLSGGPPLVAEPGRRDGYIAAPPDHPAAVAEALFDITDLVGEFEKPAYVSYDADICAHARSGITGCTNCLDVCPTSAIRPDGDHVHIDGGICGGCGNCSAVCPTGAVSYAYPKRQDLIGRCQALVAAYLAAGGTNPCLLIHDDTHGAPLISALARFGRGLPGHVLPLSLHSPLSVGHELLACAFAAGAQKIFVLISPQRPEEHQALHSQAELTNTLVAKLGYRPGDSAVQILSESDPDRLEDALFEPVAPGGFTPHPIAAMGSKRDIARLAISNLHAAAPEPCDIIALPATAPFGRVVVDSKGCTLCLACVSCCPVGALSDHPDKPQLRLSEDKCVQCGICRATCPESVITLEPRYNFTDDARLPIVLHEDEPFECIRCGKPFGSKRSIDRVTEILVGKNPMFRSAQQAAFLKMCEDCRVIAIAESTDDPFKVGTRPRVRTTEDYLASDAGEPGDDQERG